MNRFGIEWNRTKIDGKNYIHVGIFLDSERKDRAAAWIAAGLAIAAFVTLITMFPDVDTKPTIEVLGGLR